MTEAAPEIAVLKRGRREAPGQERDLREVGLLADRTQPARNSSKCRSRALLARMTSLIVQRPVFGIAQARGSDGLPVATPVAPVVLPVVAPVAASAEKAGPLGAGCWRRLLTWLSLLPPSPAISVTSTGAKEPLMISSVSAFATW